MALFLSTFVNGVDAKGRVSVPASFRAEGDLGSDQKVVLYPSFSADCLEGCDLARMDELSDATDQLDTFSQEQSDLNALIFSEAQVLRIDGTGRIILPAEFIQKAKLSKEVAFVGRGKTFQIWNPKDLKAEQKKRYDAAKKKQLTLKK